MGNDHDLLVATIRSSADAMNALSHALDAVLTKWPGETEWIDRLADEMMKHSEAIRRGHVFLVKLKGDANV